MTKLFLSVAMVVVPHVTPATAILPELPKIPTSSVSTVVVPLPIVQPTHWTDTALSLDVVDGSPSPNVPPPPDPPPLDTSTWTDHDIVHLVWSAHGVVDAYTHNKMDCIIRHESGWNRYAVSPTTDYGLFQINRIHAWRWAGRDIFDPWVNAEVAWQIWAESGGSFRQWSTNGMC